MERDATRARRLAAGSLVGLLVLTAAPAMAQTDFSGEWAAMRHEDNEDRGPGPDVGDYTGLPITAAARQKAEAWDASVLSLPERQAQPHPAHYFMWGPRPNPRIEQVNDPVTGDLIGYTLKGTFGRADRTIWLDGRPRPSEYAEHTWAGFSTGEWDGDELVITTTHIKYGVVRRNGVPASPKAVVTERWSRYGNYLMVTLHIDDPMYLEEPLVRSNVLRLDPTGHTGRITPFESVDEVLTRETGNVPHYPLGTEHRGFGERVGLPFELTRGGAETIYPEYQQRVEELLRAYREDRDASDSND
jgi:hypothetical protein